MKKRLLTWMTTLAVAITMVLGGSVTASAEESAGGVTGTLDWSWSVPVTEDDYGFGYGISSPAAYSDHLYVVSYDRLYKIHNSTLEVKGIAELGGNVLYNRNAPTIAGTKVVIPLSDSRLAIVDSSTMNVTTITYAEGETGYQSNTKAVYDSEDNSVYLGSWGGSKYGTYVKVNLDPDENGDYTVTKIVDNKGFYYAGAAINGDYVVFGSEGEGDENGGTATLYAWNKTTPDEEPISCEIEGSGSIRSAVVVYDDAYYFTAKGGKFYKATINEDGTKITAEEITQLGATSICSPIIVEEDSAVYAYAGYQIESGWDSLGGVKKVNLTTTPGESTLVTDDVPAGVSSLFKHSLTTGETYKTNVAPNVYATYNGEPGGIWNVSAGEEYFTPTKDDNVNMQNYCLSTIAELASANRMYYTNDSGYLMAVKEADTDTKHRLIASAGEGGTVTPSVSYVTDGSTKTLYIIPDAGYRISSVKVNGEKQTSSELYAYAGTTKFTTQKLTEDTQIEVEFAKLGDVVTIDVDMSIQQGDVFDMAHEKLTVSSDVAETYGYQDKVFADKVSALDALVAAHVKRYGKDKRVINENLVMSYDGSNPDKMMGKDAENVTTAQRNAATGIAINGGMARMSEGDMAVTNNAEVKDGDCIDFFWYVTYSGMGDIFTAFLEDGERLCAKTVREGESFDISFKGFSTTSAMNGKEYEAFETEISYMSSYYPEEYGTFSTTGAELILLQKNADGTYSKGSRLTDADGKAIATGADAAVNLKLAKGKYYLTAEKEVLNEEKLEARTLMPWLELTVLCEKHSFKDDKCEVCEFEKTDISKGTAVLSFDKADYTGKAIEPTVKVTVDGKELKLKDDYTVEYSNNIEPGTATVTIKGTGYYTGRLTKTFSIVKPKSPETSTDTNTEKKPSGTSDNGADIPDEGEVLKDKNNTAKYEIIESEDGTVEVAYAAPINKKKASVIVPATVTLADGTKAKVTAIKVNAFKGNKKIKKLTIGKNVEKIGKKAFYNCKNLKKLTIKSKKLTASKVGKNAFKGVYSKAKVDVPKSKVKAYKKFFYKKGLSKKARIY